MQMPPELLLMGQMSRAVDVYSFGVVCWEMFMGQRPYQGMSHSQVLHHVGQSGTPLQLPPSAPQGFRALVTACLNREPMQR
jgi:serine/threonine protein kinase